jgi:hypothetical protein
MLPFLHRTEVITRVIIDLEKGGIVKGKDVGLLESETCEVVWVELWYEGELFGNYTEDHFMLNELNGTQVQPRITACPLVQKAGGFGN